MKGSAALSRSTAACRRTERMFRRLTGDIKGELGGTNGGTKVIDVRIHCCSFEGVSRRIRLRGPAGSPLVL